MYFRLVPEQLCVGYSSFCRNTVTFSTLLHTSCSALPVPTAVLPWIFLEWRLWLQTAKSTIWIGFIVLSNLCTRVCHCVKNPTLWIWGVFTLFPLRTTAMCRCLLGTLSLSCYTENQNFGWTASVGAASFPSPSVHTHFNPLGPRLEQQVSCSMQRKRWGYFENPGHLQLQHSILLCLCP